MNCNCTDLDNFYVMIPSHRPDRAKATHEALGNADNVIHIDGTGAKNFSWLINRCIVECPTEIVVVASDKSRGSIGEARQMVAKVKDGYGFVGFCCFGFFALKKEWIRQIGFMDERFFNGSEDSDMLLRSIEADIAYYENRITSFAQEHSTWKEHRGRAFRSEKWEEAKKYIRRKLPEEVYNYDIGPVRGCEFLPASSSRLGKHSQYVLERKFI